MTSIAILIPARFNSTRFKGKPLCNLGDSTMIQRVFYRCLDSGFDTYVVTDSPLISRLFKPEEVIVSADECDNGTDRCAEALNDSRLNQYTHFINVQGDMPDINNTMIDACATELITRSSSVNTLYTECHPDKRRDVSAVKLIKTDTDKALWFGRGFAGYGERHLGVYGFSRDALEKYRDLPIPPEEEVEQLEQLRWIKSGHDIHTVKVDFEVAGFDGIEINTPLDMNEWNNRYTILSDHDQLWEIVK